MDLELQDKVAIVGGASKGLGRACAEVLAEEGARVAMCSRTPTDLDRAADEIRSATGADILTFAGDLDNYETIQKLIATTVDRFGRLDIMVNNSGGPPLARSANASEEQWETAVQRSLFFFARMSREALPHLRAQGGVDALSISWLARFTNPSRILRSRGQLGWRSSLLPRAWPMKLGGTASWSIMSVRAPFSPSACSPM